MVLRLMASYPYDPDYVVPTSEVLREWLDENHLSPRVAVAHVTRDPNMRSHLAAVLAGILESDTVVDEDTAELLGAVTGISKRFWISFERNYRTGRAAGKTVSA